MLGGRGREDAHGEPRWMILLLKGTPVAAVEQFLGAAQGRTRDRHFGAAAGLVSRTIDNQPAAGASYQLSCLLSPAGCVAFQSRRASSERPVSARICAARAKDCFMCRRAPAAASSRVPRSVAR